MLAGQLIQPGRIEVRQTPDQLFDHYAAEFTFPDGARLRCRSWNGSSR